VHVLYEEEGDYKAGTVVAEAPASVQLDTLHGRRVKVKVASLLLRFAQPAPAQLLLEARTFADSLDIEFLWQCSGQTEFSFSSLAREYVGREPTPPEAAGVLIKLHQAPIYFSRRGPGRFQPTPAETLKAALASELKKQRQREQIRAWTEQLARFECPPEIAAARDELLYAPDRNKAVTKAFEQACKASGLSAPRLLERCGLLTDSREYQLQRFLHDLFPRGAGFPEHEPAVLPDDLPLAAAQAISLDDIGTTEIDDAFSVERLSDDELRIGIHIAAPALGFAPGSTVDAIARERLSTAYLPGEKFTMLPEDVIASFSLDHGTAQPAASLYLTVSARDYSIRAQHSRFERIHIAANLRHAQYDGLNAAFEKGAQLGLPFEDDLLHLWKLALVLAAGRGKASVQAGMLDYLFYVENDRVRIEPRRRGQPLETLVSELMIFTNSTWGALLAERDLAALYRVQSSGKVRLSVHPEAHEGLGVKSYAWMTSPLRRYVDLINQWQLAAALLGRRAPFARNSDALLSAMRAFEVTYARYDEHQRAMENFWCLRWLVQERLASIAAVVLREKLVRIDGMPLTARVASLPELAAGTRVSLAIENVDLIERQVSFQYRATLTMPQPAVGEALAQSTSGEQT